MCSRDFSCFYRIGDASFKKFKSIGLGNPFIVSASSIFLCGPTILRRIFHSLGFVNSEVRLRLLFLRNLSALTQRILQRYFIMLFLNVRYIDNQMQMPSKYSCFCIFFMVLVEISFVS